MPAYEFLPVHTHELEPDSAPDKDIIECPPFFKEHEKLGEVSEPESSLGINVVLQLDADILFLEHLLTIVLIVDHFSCLFFHISFSFSFTLFANFL
jgi:hypothetical protein